MKLHLTSVAVLLIAAACAETHSAWVSSTYETPWQNMEPSSEISSERSIEVNPSRKLHKIEGFGTCFNELGWASLSELGQSDMEDILNELFSPEGANFTMGRMPVGANDFSLGYYSYAGKEEDFALEHFTVAHDEQYLIPFIKAAQSVNPDLKIWASPWCPPSWMKVNRHFAEKAA